MEYEPTEGIDYVIDLYGVTGVAPDAEPTEIKEALHRRQREYHPDRLQGLAPEFIAKGERMAALLNRAQFVLLQPEKRAAYDAVLQDWTGPVSKDGTPMLLVSTHKRIHAAKQTPEALEASLRETADKVAAMTGYSPAMVSMFETLYEANPENREARDAYEAALLQKDRVLAIDEAERRELLGVTVDKQYRASLGYAETTDEQLAAAREQLSAEYRFRAVGGVATRLALISGQTGAGGSIESVPPTDTPDLPAFFTPQAKQIRHLAEERQAIAEKRLALFQPEYPEADRQPEAHSTFLVGISSGGETPVRTWIGFRFDPETIFLENIDVSADITALAENGAIEAVYKAGFNVLTFEAKEQLELRDMLDEACNKHIQRYFPGLLDD